MSINICDIVIELFGASTNITLFIPIRMKLSPKTEDKSIAAYIKFSILVQKRVDVLLNKGSFPNF